MREEPFKEIDGRPGWYAGGSLRQDGLGRLSALYYDNRADPAAHIGSDFGWRTRFTSAGAGNLLSATSSSQLQAMVGNTDIQPFGNFHSTTDFQSAYLLPVITSAISASPAGSMCSRRSRTIRSGSRGPGEHGRAFTLSGSWALVGAGWRLSAPSCCRSTAIASANGGLALQFESPASCSVQFVGRIFL